MPLPPLSYGLPRAGSVGGYSLTDEDEDSLVRKAANVGLSGLGIVGNVLDVPGSVIRDALTWLPGGRAANPFDQLLPWNWATSEGRTSGRDLLTDYGLTAPNKETGIAGWRSDPMEGVRDVAGFGAELVTDPFWWMNLGTRALGKGAQAVKAAGLGQDVGRMAAKKLGRDVGPREAGMLTKVGDVLAAASPQAQQQAKRYAEQAGYSLSDYLNEPMRGLANVQPPFMNPIGLLGTGPRAQKVAAWLDKYSPNIFGGEFGTQIPLIGSEKPLGRAIRSLLHAPTLGRLEKEVVPHAQAFFNDQTKDLADAKTLAAQWSLKAERSGVYDPRQTARAAEGVAGAVDPTGLGDEMRDMMAQIPARERAAGFRSREFQDEYIDYAARQAGPHNPLAAMNEEIGGKAKGPMSAAAGSDQQMRESLLRGFPGGREQINDLVSDPDVHRLIEEGQAAGKSRSAINADVATLIQQKYSDVDPLIPKTTNKGKTYHFVGPGGKQMEVDLARVEAGQWGPKRESWMGYLGKSPNEQFGTWAVVSQRETRYEALADWIQSNPGLRSGLFTRDPLLEGADRWKSLLNRESVSRNALNFVDDEQRALGALHGAGKSDTIGETVPLGDFLKKIGMDADLGAEAYARKAGMPVPKDKLAIFEDVHAQRMTPEQADVAFRELAAFNENVKNLPIRKNLVDDYTKPIWNPSAKGTPLEPLVAKWDAFSHLFKAGVLSWPSTKVRDLTSGQIESGLRNMWRGADARAGKLLMTGGTIEGAAQNPAIRDLLKRAKQPLTDEAASDLLRATYAGHSSGSIQASLGDITQQTAPVYGAGREELLDLIPGIKKRGVFEGLGDLFGALAGRGDTTWNPLKAKVRGVGEATKSTFAPIAAMERAGEITDMANRLVPFLNQVRRGVDPGEAMRRVASAQVSYDPRTFTAAERALKRVMPFYSYATRKGVDIGKTLLSEPGGPTAQTLRAIGAGRPSAAVLPEHIADTAAIPLPAQVDDGTKRYLTGLGLMMEGPLQFVGGPRAAGLELLSSLNPLVKGPLEWATGQTFFQKGPGGGRSLEDLDPTIGRTLANIEQGLTGVKQEKPVATPDWLEALLGNLPTSRIGTSLRQLTDTRKSALDKAIALGSGINFSDVSPAAQDAQLREALTRMEKVLGGKTFTKAFIPEDVKAAMSPAERDAALKMESLMNVLNRRAHERAKERAAKSK